MSCPWCGYDVGEIGCEKTVTCSCGRELKYGDNEDLVEVEENDPIYWDR